MSIPREPDPAKLVVGVITGDKGLFPAVLAALADAYGDVDLVSRWFAFDETDYYAPEMGGPLFRRMAAFRDPVEQKSLPDVKQFTNRMEVSYARDGKRRVNIDPGYLLPARFVLATGKNFTHRIYLDRGIYADLTLIFQNGRFVSLPWTYADYAGEEIQAFLMAVRKKVIAEAHFRNNPEKAGQQRQE